MLKAGAGVAYKIVVANRDEILSGSNPLPCRKFQSRAHVKQRYCCTYRRDQTRRHISANAPQVPYSLIYATSITNSPKRPDHSGEGGTGRKSSKAYINLGILCLWCIEHDFFMRGVIK